MTQFDSKTVILLIDQFVHGDLLAAGILWDYCSENSKEISNALSAGDVFSESEFVLLSVILGFLHESPNLDPHLLGAYLVFYLDHRARRYFNMHANYQLDNLFRVYTLPVPNSDQYFYLRDSDLRNLEDRSVRIISPGEWVFIKGNLYSLDVIFAYFDDTPRPYAATCHITLANGTVVELYNVAGQPFILPIAGEAQRVNENTEFTDVIRVYSYRHNAQMVQQRRTVTVYWSGQNWEMR